MNTSFKAGGILRAGMVAAAFSLVVLGVLAALAGQPFWMPLNVTTQALYGPEVAQIREVDLGHTVLGLLIHVASCIFWAAIAFLLMGWVGSAVLAGFGTALLALVIDYGILPERLSPGWHLSLSFPAVICGFIAMGAGLAVGLPQLAPSRARRGRAGTMPHREPPLTHGGPEALRHPGPRIIDQRQQRIDPANEVTEDPNRRSDLNRKQPGGSKL
ncbi:hypothetical protein [Paracoccus ravus]|uniref:hypothetical protein n=1 Tax=Paracoccus ravus TaxID=2447760 RepID=UPI001FD6D88C|nr:hypothetical protein [Paracoccus ravus]